MFVACGIWCLADVSSVSPSSELEMSAKHHIPQATNIPYSTAYSPTQKNSFFFKIVFEVCIKTYLTVIIRNNKCAGAKLEAGTVKPW